MPQGDKSKYTDKQKRQAEHIEESYEQRGLSPKRAAARAWATVNKTSGGGKKSGSGRKRSAASGRVDRTTAKGKSRTAADRSRAARKGWETRRRQGK